MRGCSGLWWKMVCALGSDALFCLIVELKQSGPNQNVVFEGLNIWTTTHQSRVKPCRNKVYTTSRTAFIMLRSQRCGKANFVSMKKATWSCYLIPDTCHRVTGVTCDKAKLNIPEFLQGSNNRVKQQPTEPHRQRRNKTSAVNDATKWACCRLCQHGIRTCVFLSMMQCFVGVFLICSYTLFWNKRQDVQQEAGDMKTKQYAKSCFPKQSI